MSQGKEDDSQTRPELPQSKAFACWHKASQTCLAAANLLMLPHTSFLASHHGAASALTYLPSVLRCCLQTHCEGFGALSTMQWNLEGSSGTSRTWLHLACLLDAQECGARSRPSSLSSYR